VGTSQDPGPASDLATVELVFAASNSGVCLCRTFRQSRLVRVTAERTREADSVVHLGDLHLAHPGEKDFPACY
jgi:hypothetical protein